MKTTKGKTVEELRRMSPEAEREYLDSIDPLHQGQEMKLRKLKTANVLHYFSIRIDPVDLDRLAVAARKKGMKPSELARNLIVCGLDQDENSPTLESRLSKVEREIARLATAQPTATKKTKPNGGKALAKV